MPTVFAAHGLTLTAAFELALCCDILLAAEQASLRAGRDRRRAHPVDGRAAAAGRAGRPGAGTELVFTGERYPAAVLERWNVVNRVLPDDGFAEAARAYAHRVAAGPTVAHAATKRLVATAVRQGARAADALVPEVSGALFATEDLRGAVRLLPHRRTGQGDVHRAVTPSGDRGSGVAARVASTGPPLPARKAGSRVLARHLPERPRDRCPHVP